MGTYNLVKMRFDLVGLDIAVVLKELTHGPDVWRELLLVYQPEHFHDIHLVFWLSKVVG